MRHLLDNIGKYLTPFILKRAADALEKLGVASLLWALFQNMLLGYLVSCLSLFFSFYLTYKLGREKTEKEDQNG